MPQVDLETIVCGGSNNDRKIACETLASTSNSDEVRSEKPNVLEIPTDFPAESYYVSREDEFDWFDRNAFFDRQESTKANSNPAISISKRYYMNIKSKASIFSLPKPQKTNYLEGKIRRNTKHHHHQQVNPRFFPKRSRSTGKSTVPLSEPSSPKVSCIGRVRSKRDRSRRLRLQRAKEQQQQQQKQKQESDNSTPVRRTSEKAGLWKKVKAKLKIGRRETQSVVVSVDKETTKKDEKTLPASRKISMMSSSERFEPTTESTGLAGLKRFSSGRRSESWIDLEMEESGNSPGKESGTVWARRGVGPVMEVQVDRDWECEGPVTL